MNINWYPGHMKKSTDKIKESLKLVDVVAELVDARIPISSRNPKIQELLENKPHMIIMNKRDLSDPRENERWKAYFKNRGMETMLVDALHDRGSDKLYNTALLQLKDLMERKEEKNIINKEIRMMIVGIPNVGKSTFINNIARRRGTKVGDRPGVTRINQWIKTEDNIVLLDTPGVLWPKFESEEVGLNLAFTGAIRDEIMDVETLAFRFVKKIMSIDPQVFERRYGIKALEDPVEIMDAIALKRGAILKGKEIDYFKVSNIILNEYRAGLLGAITLERIEDL